MLKRIKAVVATLITMGVNGFAIAQNLPLLCPLSADATLALVSQNGNTPTSIEFVNGYGAPVDIDWIDYQGKIVPYYGSLQPNQSYLQPTYVTHPWIIYDATTGLPIEGFLPLPQEGEALITTFTGGSTGSCGCASASTNAKRAAAASGSAAGQCTPLTITTTELPPAQAYSLSTPRASLYSAQLAASGGVGAYTFTVTGLPPGLTANANGVITGVDSSAVPDDYNISILVKDGDGSTASKALILTTLCGDPAIDEKGDDRDTLIGEYVKANVQVHPGPAVQPKFRYPHCDEETEGYPQFNIGTKKCAPEFLIALVQEDLPDTLATWQQYIGKTAPRAITSAYRDPVVQACSGSKQYPAAKNSQHEHGDAIDLATINITSAKDYELLSMTAILSGFSWLETYQKTKYPCQPNRGACVHADMRFYSSSFIYP